MKMYITENRPNRLFITEIYFSRKFFPDFPDIQSKFPDFSWLLTLSGVIKMNP